MADASARRVIQRYKALHSTRTGYWDSNWQQIADHVVGRRDFIRNDTPGRRREIEIYDTTGRNMVNLLAGGMHSLLFGPDWFLLRTAELELMEERDVRIWLEDCQKRMLGVFDDPEARFTPQMDEALLDLVAFGTAGLYVGDPPGKPIEFSARPLPELYLGESASGVVDTVMRKFKLTARQAVQQWGDAAPEKARKQAAGNQSEDQLEFLHAVYPADVARIGFGGRMPFESLFISLDDESIIGAPGGFHEMPFLTPRWRVDGGETYGRSPAWDALADQKMCSSMKLTSLQAGQMAVAPPVMYEDDGVTPQIDLRPFAKIPVRMGGVLNPPLQALDIKPQALIGIELIRDTRAQVQESFHFEMLKLIQNRGLTPMTAEQVRALRNAVERLLAPILKRLHSELLGPLVDRVFNIMARRGQFAPPPPILQGQSLRVEYVSPISRAQRENEIEAVSGWLAQVSAIAEKDPSALDNVDVDETIRFLGEAASVPAKLQRSRAQVAQLREAQRKLAAEEDAMEQMMGVAQAAGKMAPLVKQSA